MSPADPAFRALHAHFNLVWSALRRLGVREADVLDLSQKVFLTAHLKLPAFEGRSAISTWLFGVCNPDTRAASCVTCSDWCDT